MSSGCYVAEGMAEGVVELPREEWLVVFIVAALAMAGVVVGVLLPAFVGVLIDYMGLSDRDAGTIAAKNIFAIVAGVWFSTLLLKKLSHKKIIILGLLGIIVAEFLTVTLVQENRDYIVAVRVLAGLFSGVVLGIGMHALTQLRNSDKGFALFTFLQFLVGGVGFLSLPLVLPSSNGSAFSIGIMLLVFMLLIAVLNKRVFSSSLKLPAAAINTANEKPDNSYAGWLTVLAYGVFQCGGFSVWTYMDRIGLETGLLMEQIGVVMACGSLAGAGGACLATFLGVRFSRLFSLLAGGAIYIIGLLSIFLFGGQWSYIAGIIMVCIGWAFSIPFFLGTLAELDADGKLVMAGSSVAMIGMAMGPTLASLFVGAGYKVTVLVGIFIVLTGLLAVIPGVRAIK